MRRYFSLAFLFFLLFCVFPAVAGAGVVFSEIMYDLPDADSGREWVEIKNEGGNSVTLATSTWKFFEANTNHALSLFQGSPDIPASGFAIIADDPAKFLVDWPGFSGTIFGSSFSLGNTGETLALKSDGTVVDEVVYSSQVGAAGDGASLQKTGSGWGAFSPTPGALLSSVPVASSTSSTSPATGSETTTDQTSSVSVSSPTSAGAVNPPIERYIFVGATVPFRAVAGADLVFEANAVGIKKEPLQNARYIWNFGDGASAEGRNVLHAYHFPAVYVVLVEASSGVWSATARHDITVTMPKLSISRIEPGASGFIEVRNSGEDDLDLSRWFLRSGSDFFSFPDGTTVRRGSAVPFASSVTRLLAQPESVAVLYPNGTEAVRYISSEAKQRVNEAKEVTKKDVEPVAAVLVIQNPVSARTPLKSLAVASSETNSVTSEEFPEVSPVLPSTTVEILASVGGAQEESLFPWIGGVALVLIASVAGFLLVRSRFSSAPRGEAEKYDIVE